MKKLRINFHKTMAWVTKLPTAQLIPLALIFTYVASAPPIAFAVFDPGAKLGGPTLTGHDFIKAIVLGCIVAPLLETALMQWACIRILKKVGISTGLAVLVSAIFFGLEHYYSVLYMSLTFCVGLVLGSVFAIEDARRGSPFLATFTVHALHNAITTGILIFSI